MENVLIAHGETVNDTPVTIVDGHKVPQPSEVKQDFQPQSDKPEKQLLLELHEQVRDLTEMFISHVDALREVNRHLISEVAELRAELAALKQKPIVDRDLHTQD